MDKSINLDDLHNEAKKLVSLLDDRQLGLMTWNDFLVERLKNIHKMIDPVVVSILNHGR